MARKTQAIRKLQITCDDLEEALDNLEEALEFTRKVLADRTNRLIGELPAGEQTLINHPFDEEAFETTRHNLKEARDIAARAITDFDWRTARALHLLAKALRPSGHG